MFITLTAITGDKVRINIKRLNGYGKDDTSGDYTICGRWMVQESPDQIDEMLRRQGIDVLRPD